VRYRNIVQRLVWADWENQTKEYNLPMRRPIVEINVDLDMSWLGGANNEAATWTYTAPECQLSRIEVIADGENIVDLTGHEAWLLGACNRFGMPFKDLSDKTAHDTAVKAAHAPKARICIPFGEFNPLPASRFKSLKIRFTWAGTEIIGDTATAGDLVSASSLIRIETVEQDNPGSGHIRRFLRDSFTPSATGAFDHDIATADEINALIVTAWNTAQGTAGALKDTTDAYVSTLQLKADFPGGPRTYIDDDWKALRYGGLSDAGLGQLDSYIIGATTPDQDDFKNQFAGMLYLPFGGAGGILDAREAKRLYLRLLILTAAKEITVVRDVLTRVAA